MKSRRNRFFHHKPAASRAVRTAPSFGPAPHELAAPLDLSEMPSPADVATVSPEDVVTDILICTLVKVQQTANAEVAAAASRFLANLR